MILTYEAIGADGRTTSDTVEASDAREAVEHLRRRGLYVTHIGKTAGRRARSAALHEESASARLPLRTLVLFTRQMAMLLRAGSGVVPAVTAIKRQMRKPAHIALLEQVVADLEDGATLTDALRRHPRTFDPVYCAVVAAGEASAALPEMFNRLAVIVGKRRAMHNKILGSLAYPTLLIGMSGSIMLVLLFFVLPRFNDMFVQLHIEAPTSTRVMLGLAGMLATYWPVVLALAVLTGVTVFLLAASDRGRQLVSNVQLSIPLFGKLRSRLIQVQVFRTMGTLIQSDVSVLDTLELVCGSTRNGRFQRLFAELDRVVTSGGKLSTAFEESGVVDPSICQAVHTGEDCGNLGEALTYCADVLEETNAELVNTITKLLEPAILIGMGLVVGTIAVSLFMPLFDMTSALR